MNDPDAHARTALRLIGPDPQNWVPDRPGIDHNVMIVGGGQSGSAFAFALRRAGIGKVAVIDMAADDARAGQDSFEALADLGGRLVRECVAEGGLGVLAEIGQAARGFVTAAELRTVQVL